MQVSLVFRVRSCYVFVKAAGHMCSTFFQPKLRNHRERKDIRRRVREKEKELRGRRDGSFVGRFVVLLTFAAIVPQISGQTLLTLGPCSALLTFTKSCAITAIIVWAKGITITLWKNKTHIHTQAGNRAVLGLPVRTTYLWLIIISTITTRCFIIKTMWLYFRKNATISTVMETEWEKNEADYRCMSSLQHICDHYNI